MGFFSWTCAKTGLPVMASTSWLREEIGPMLCAAVLVGPKGEITRGFYDGYGRLGDRDLMKDGMADQIDHGHAALVLESWYDREALSELPDKSRHEPGQGHFHDPVELTAQVARTDLWVFVGNGNLDDGGLFYTVTASTSAKAVEIRPVERDDSGHVQSWAIVTGGKISMPHGEAAEALATNGYECLGEFPLRIVDPTGAIITGRAADQMRIEAFHASTGINGGSTGTLNRTNPEDGRDLAGFLIETDPALKGAIGAPKVLRKMSVPKTSMAS